MRKHGSVYLHVGNSGVTLGVHDEGFGPTLLINWGAFGNLSSELKVHTTPDSLGQLAAMLFEASLQDNYSEVYCHPAEASRSRRGDSASTSDSVQKKAKHEDAPDDMNHPTSLSHFIAYLGTSGKVPQVATPPRTWKDTVRMLMKASVVFASPKHGGARYRPHDLSNGKTDLFPGEVLELAVRGFLSLSEDGWVTFNSDHAL